MSAKQKTPQNGPGAALRAVILGQCARPIPALLCTGRVRAISLVLALSPLAAAAAELPARTRPAPPANALVRPVAVFGADDRTPVPQSLSALEGKIGVIYDRRSRSVCTTFCVAPGTVATAAHCLYRTAGETPMRLTDLSIRLHGGSAATGIAGADKGAPEANVTSGSTRLSVRPPIDATQDWALVRLAEPLCKAGGLKISPHSVEEVMRLSAKGRVYNVGYHRDLPKWQPMLGRPCRVKRSFNEAPWSTISRDFSNPGELILHTCDTGGASSGSPLLVDGRDGPEVIGINVGTYVQSKVILLNGEVVHRFKSDDVANTGVNAQAFAPTLAIFRNADLLASSRDILRLQDALAAHALYAGPRDGHYGPELKSAIEAFERAAAMPITGLATRPLLTAVLGESHVVTGKLPSRASAGAPKVRR
jgi:protease YdgD